MSEQEIGREGKLPDPMAMTTKETEEVARHTAGPWDIVPATAPDNVGGYDCAIVDSRQKIIGEAFEIVDYGYGGTVYERLPAVANARLMSKAPELARIVAIFLGHDDRFQIMIGGNPNAVDAMLSEARAVYAAALPAPTGEQL